MRFSISTFALVAPFLVSAAPTRFAKRASNTDSSVFGFADVLEQLETQFYSQALARFKAADFQAAGFTNTDLPMQLFTSIQNDESTHTTVIASELTALGGSAITGCTFDFSSVLTDVTTMAATARLIENVGVAAYLGGSTLLTDPQLIAAAGSIMTVEARHQTVLNILNLGNPISAPFDIALTPPEVLAIAGGFISGCNIGIPANPPLTIANTGAVTTGTHLTFSSPAINGSVSTDSFFCQMIVGGVAISTPLPFNQCIVPTGIDGPVVLFITSDGQPLANNVVERANAQLVAGPVMTFIDTVQSSFGPSVRSSTGSGSTPSTSTQTISPAQAQSLLSSASASAASSTPMATAKNAVSAPTPSGPSPNVATGLSKDGSMDVIGWTMVPASSV